MKTFLVSGSYTITFARPYKVRAVDEDEVLGTLEEEHAGEVDSFNLTIIEQEEPDEPEELNV